MKKVAIAVLVAAASTLCFPVPQAQASPCNVATGCVGPREINFLRSMASVGITGRPWDLVSQALVVCGYMFSGTSQDEMVNEMQSHPHPIPVLPTYWSAQQAAAFVATGKATFCPDGPIIYFE